LIDRKQSEPWAASQNVAEEAWGSSILEAGISSGETGFFIVKTSVHVLKYGYLLPEFCTQMTLAEPARKFYKF